MSVWLFTAIVTGGCWGIATYALGRAARDVSPPLLTALYNFFAFLMFGTLFLMSDEPNKIGAQQDLILKSGLTGLLGGLGFAAGLSVISIALSKGRAGVVGPSVSSVEVLIPFIYAVSVSNLPNNIAIVGIVLLFFVPWLVTRTKNTETQYSTSISRDVTLGAISGAGFGSYYIALIIAPVSASLLTMTIIQGVSALAMVSTHIAYRKSWTIKRSMWLLCSIFVILEIIGAITLRLSLIEGSPAVVSTVATVFYVAFLLAMSYVINKERFSRFQIAGFILTFIGIALVVINT